jgi:epoxyqueuosine reductase QueG
MGADLCGIASAEGFGLEDIFPGCRSIIVFAKRFPKGTFQCGSPLPYAAVKNALSAALNGIAAELCVIMEKFRITAVPSGEAYIAGIKSGVSNSGEPDAVRILSSEKAAVAAGLGRIGRNGLLITPEYGAMIMTEAVITDFELEADEILSGSPCPQDCKLCADYCVLKAPDGSDKDLKDCLNCPVTAESLKCRRACPRLSGDKNSE